MGLLKLLEASSSGKSVKWLARKLNRPETNVHRTLLDLEEHGEVFGVYVMEELSLSSPKHVAFSKCVVKRIYFHKKDVRSIIQACQKFIEQTSHKRLSRHMMVARTNCERLIEKVS